MPTLVKDTQNLLPISPARYRKFIESPGKSLTLSPVPIAFQLFEIMWEKRFEVSVYDIGEKVETSAYDLLF